MKAVWDKIRIMLEMIKFEHSVFALPFALMGALLAARGLPEPTVLFWLIFAMVTARTAAMGFNRIVDRRFDAANPRTADRAIPAGAVKLWEAWLLVLLAAALFFFACYMLNPLALLISPLALGLAFIYSLTKRFTWFCHVVLGLALALSPLGGWVAVAGSLESYPWLLSLGVALWVAGFDTVYACLDAKFDREAGLYSLPACFGSRRAFRLAGLAHILAFVCFVATGLLMNLHIIFGLGLAVAAAALIYQHRAVSPGDLSKIKLSFFTANGLISLVMFAATWLALVVGG
ncbi:UbiA-like polyprenyltransferase [Desulfurivibrio alkaliphilus]|uniref:4-hydroxybenzoate polyprenyltransferase n=1 Tax=Desulfurivibrio alkaliphilus (strain DSM 19089 / UNIQEM U267 / AHT2) TaxID=589865 RepID=D6Z0P9_DESAT|nr:UbiA-like polyprenyltransferase [Desulfurivibrio alkaliphilus]ADH85278.1 4-hydroxybenzoate polyprenyltransferase [Desulfurivibrio alkaliphilus AHT 2]